MIIVFLLLWGMNVYFLDKLRIQYGMVLSIKGGKLSIPLFTSYSYREVIPLNRIYVFYNSVLLAILRDGGFTPGPLCCRHDSAVQ